ncbi:hypothetical protein [Acuticoccus sediminis]|nr:hypothetical protein [Acuticoccus sediminis]
MPQDHDPIEQTQPEKTQSSLPEYLILLALVVGSLTAGINAFPF